MPFFNEATTFRWWKRPGIVGDIDQIYLLQ